MPTHDPAERAAMLVYQAVNLKGDLDRETTAEGWCDEHRTELLTQVDAVIRLATLGWFIANGVYPVTDADLATGWTAAYQVAERLIITGAMPADAVAPF